jgi:large exoprotein involved in heme utilization and adhesion
VGRTARAVSNTLSLGDAGRLVVSAPLLTMDDGGRIEAAASDDESRGNAGGADLRVGRLALTGGAQIASGTFGEGRGGELTVVASEAITIAGLNSGLFTNTFGEGDAGRLVVSAPILNMEGGQILASAEPGSRGNAGSLEVQVRRLTLTGDARISTGTVGSGRGGELRVVASDTIAISGGSGLLSSTFGSGDAGRLVVSAPTLMMDGGTIEAITAGAGRGGDIQVAATHLQLRNDSTILASSFGTGDAGAIRLQIGETFRSDNSRVATASTRAGGGRIELRAGRLVQLFDSELTTSVRGGGGDAGNLTLTAPFVIAEGSQIIANAFEGQGGNILINAGVFLADPASLVSASSALGIQGTVNIQAPVTSLSGTLAPLPQAFVSAEALLPARCAARAQGGRYSSLVLGGRGGLPADPSGVLPSPLLLEARLAADPAGIGVPHPPRSPAQFAFLADHEKALPRLGCPK